MRSTFVEASVDSKYTSRWKRRRCVWGKKEGNEVDGEMNIDMRSINGRCE